MSLRNALLGFLSYGPMTGYDLKKHMDNSTQFFWHAKLSQIYPTLKKMEAEGLVEVVIVPQEGKPDKKVYTLTDAGREELLAWLTAPLDSLPSTKEPVLLQLFFAGTLDKETILAQLQRQLSLHRAQLALYQQETAAYVEEIITSTGLTQEGVMWELVRQFGEQYERQFIQWLEHAIEVVEEKL